MRILDKKQIKQKVIRLAYQIIEQNINEQEIVLAGINNNGHAFAKIIHKELKKIEGHNLNIELTRIRLNPANPMANHITIDTDSEDVKKKVIIIVDDVANTGRTLFYSFQPFLDSLVKKIQVAVLIDRKHKSFPVAVDFVGLSLATTINNNIEVSLNGDWTVEIV